MKTIEQLKEEVEVLENNNKRKQQVEIERIAKRIATLHCYKCGSGDVGYCQISVKPHCNECDTWGQVNYGNADEAIDRWKARYEKAGF